MSNLNYPFAPVAHEDWVLQIQKELRDQTERMLFKDSIEGLELDVIEPVSIITPIDFSSFRDSVNNVHFERIQTEKESNRCMLLALMQGANALFIQIEKAEVDWNIVFDNIELAYIRTEIIIQQSAQLDSLKNQLNSEQLEHLVILNDVLVQDQQEGCQAYFNGFELQQIGSNSIDELSLILSSYHHHLSNGIRSAVVFSVGIGANYFVQMAKIRALHYLINKISSIHGIQHPSYRIQAHVGWVNKSLKDPYTNLLRQTSEAMSAYAGGVHGLVIHPWDEYAQEGKEDFTVRMSLNILNLLSDEAHFSWVQDPMKGSRIVEGLTNQFIVKTWKRIQNLTDMDESSMISTVMRSIEKTRKQRRAQWDSGQDKLIGVHYFLNSDKSKAKSWGELPHYLGKEYLTVEKLN
jgi:methylmalonyl-CoA mutase